MEFVFDSVIKPKQDNFSSLDDLEKHLFKKAKDVNGSNKCYGDIYSGLDDIMETNCGLPESIVEKYRVGWNLKYSNYHKGYLWYLYSAFMSDAGIEIAPWYLYNVIFHQIAQVIKNNEEEYRNIFTSSQKKITIKMSTFEFDIGIYTEYIKKLIPNTEIYDTFFPSWSNPPPNYNECIKGLFADMVQKYYGAYVYGCSCPKVRVLGNQEDWDKLYHTIVKLKEIFNSNNSHSLDEYLSKVIKCLEDFKFNWTNNETWKKFFFVTNCGSGHQEGIGGTIRKLLNYNSNGDMLVHQLPNTLSRFPFEMAVPGMEKQKESYYISGIVGSNLDSDGYLVPYYDYSITYIDNELTQLDENKLNELKWIREQLEKWERVSVGGKYIKHHFNHNCSQYLSVLNYRDFLNEEEVKIINSNDSNILDEYLNKLFKNEINNHLEFKKEYGNMDGFVIGEEPTFLSVKNEFEQRKKNGTKEQYVKQIEKERLEKITNNSTYSHLWFEGITNIEASKFGWSSNKTAKLNLSQYLKQVDKINEYTLELENPEYLKKITDEIKYLNTMLETQYNLSDIIYGTLNPQIIKLYDELFPSESEYIIKKLLDKMLGTKNFEFSFSNSYSNANNENLHFTLDDDLVQYLTKKFFIQLNELLNKQIDLTIEKLENDMEKINNLEYNSDSAKSYYVDRLKSMSENILKIIELKKKINSNITEQDLILSNNI